MSLLSAFGPWRCRLVVAGFLLTAGARQAYGEQEHVAHTVVERARHHFQQGVILFQEGDNEAALVEFRTSYRLIAAPSVLYNIGVVERAMRRYPDALASFTQYLADAPEDDAERRETVEGLVQQLEARIGELSMDITPAESAILIDGDFLGEAPLAEPVQLSVGEHDIEVVHEGFRTHRDQVEIVGRQSLHLDITLRPIAPWYQRWWFWSIVGVVVVGGIVAAIMPVVLRPSGARFEVRLEPIQ